MKCFYHSADLDGKCSAAIIKNKYPKCELMPINYGQPFPMNKIKNNEEIYMVDFSLQPFEQMLELNDMADLIWIDHHSSAINESVFFNVQDNINGRRDVRLAACELVWHYTHNEPIPKGVTYLGRYDVWDHHSNKDILSFQYGMRALDADPSLKIWEDVFISDEVFIDNIVREGRAILNYIKIDNTEYIEIFGFETTIDNFKCICANRGKTNSQLFESIWDEAKYDIMLTFCRLPSDQWTVSLYTTKNAINVGKIAKKFGGGGHSGAAGFQCKELPFDIGNKL